MAQPVHLRADAQHNREKLVAAARAAFAEQGLDVSLDDIAKRAGVGRGTLYRHFATRDDLIAAVFIDREAEIAALAEDCQQHDDPWTGFANYVRETCQAQAADRGLADLIAVGHPSPELKMLRIRAYAGMKALIERAKADGSLREDFTPEDVVLLLLAVAGIIRRTGRLAPRATNRFVSLALDGFRAEGATPAPRPVSNRTLIAATR
jgi:AcrR family transcriptional regulator